MRSAAIARARPSCIRDILRRADARVVVEFEPQSRIEGEIQQLDPALSGHRAHRSARRPVARRALNDRDVTIFDSVGFALEDFSALRYLHRIHHEERGAQQEIDLVPDLDGPEGPVRAAAAAAADAHRCARGVAA